jgi:hypothetical protein
LPVELRAYGPEFDQYGRWDNVAPYGAVWVPAVAAGWRPYYDGSWGYTRYGWTWCGRDRWAWPTHHYGRWGYNGASWFWIPTNIWGRVGQLGVLGGLRQLVATRLQRAGRDRFLAGARSSGLSPLQPLARRTVVPRNQFGPRRPIRASCDRRESA